MVTDEREKSRTDKAMVFHSETYSQMVHIVTLTQLYERAFTVCLAI